MSNWLATLRDLAASDESAVLVTVGRVRGSAPRETGARMIVTRHHTIGSIGGGQLEYRSAELACEMLAADDKPTSVLKRSFPLGPDLGQCCGGVVDIVFEPLPGSKAEWLDTAVRYHDARTPAVIATSVDTDAGSRVVTSDRGRGQLSSEALRCADEMLAGRTGAAAVAGELLVPLTHGTIDVAVFGAGHVGVAVVDLLTKLDCRIRWIDSRRRIFPASIPASVTAIETDDAAREVASVPAGAYYLIMTHSHPLDLAICHEVLLRDDAAYRGLIGSRSKRRRFEKRLVAAGLSSQRLSHLVCPIGVDGVTGKKPAEIALAVVAQILQVRDAEQRTASGSHSLEALG